MARTSIAVVFAGSGGSGAMTAGAVFLRAAAHAGYYGMMTQLFGAQVRGGESASLVQVSACERIWQKRQKRATTYIVSVA